MDRLDVGKNQGQGNKRRLEAEAKLLSCAFLGEA